MHLSNLSRSLLYQFSPLYSLRATAFCFHITIVETILKGERRMSLIAMTLSSILWKEIGRVRNHTSKILFSNHVKFCLLVFQAFPTISFLNLYQTILTSINLERDSDKKKRKSREPQCIFHNVFHPSKHILVFKISTFFLSLLPI